MPLEGNTETDTHVSDEVLQGGVGDGDAVVGARAPSQFVQDDQRALGGSGDDFRGFAQLLHEGAAALVQVVRSPHPDDQSEGSVVSGPTTYNRVAENLKKHLKPFHFYIFH